MDHEATGSEDLKRSVPAAAALLRAMSNESRLLILCHLVEQEQSVAELEQRLNLSQSALSQHLAVLRRQGLIRSRRDKRSIYYSITSEEVIAVMNTLYDQFCGRQLATGRRVV